MSNCGNCVFGLDGDNTRIICRRFPPTVIPMRIEQKKVLEGLGPREASLICEYAFPVMRQGDWCGEYKPDNYKLQQERR